MYKILGADQKEYGPVSADQVRQWIAQRRANAQTKVQAQGTTDWKSLSEFPEFADALRGPVAPPAAPGVPPLATTGRLYTEPSSTLAITSLVLGILSFFCSFITGVPAIITGHLARSQARKSPELYGGTGMALAGLILGYFSTFVLGAVFIIALASSSSLTSSSFTTAKNRAQSITCVSNLKQIGLAARMYSNDHKDTFPPDFFAMSNELNSPKILVCPADPTRAVPANANWSNFSKQNISYVYLGAGMKEDANSPRAVILRCPIHGHVCFGDGSVQQNNQNGPGGRQRQRNNF